MKRSPFLAISLGIVCALLFFQSHLVLNGIVALSVVESAPEYSANNLPSRALLYALAVSTVPFAATGLVLLVFLLFDKPWVKRALLITSICFCLAIAGVVFLAPYLWLDHGFFALFSVAYWGYLYHSRHNAYAL